MNPGQAFEIQSIPATDTLSLKSVRCADCPVACQNGDCTQQFNSNQYYCKCKSGFSGSSCDSQSAASAPTSFNTSSVNQNCPVACVSGKCTQQFNSNQYYCQCNSGFTGSACDSASAPANATQSPSTNQACPVSCANGTCTRQFNSDQYYCKCKDGYSGANCNQLSASTPSSAPSSNQNCPVSCLNGLCTQQFNSNQYYCQCTSGWSGSSCGTLANATSPTTSASNQSCPVSCDNGRCTKQFNSDQYYCQCNSGYSGSACTTASGSAPVSSSSGTNNQSCPVACYNGDCTRQFNSDAYYCKCRSGYTGASCNANGPSTSPPGLSQSSLSSSISPSKEYFLLSPLEYNQFNSDMNSPGMCFLLALYRSSIVILEWFTDTQCPRAELSKLYPNLSCHFVPISLSSVQVKTLLVQKMSASYHSMRKGARKCSA